jgi:antirestriction protein ArdC
LKIHDLYQQVTNRIIADLAAGTPTWIKPWRNGKRVGIMPANAASGRPYSGINIPILWHEGEEKQYTTAGWMTFKQALELGGCVRKSERGTTVVFTKKVHLGENDDDKLLTLLRTFTVFNVAQIDGIKWPEDDPSGKPDLPPFVAATGADIRHGGNTACYVPSKDFVAIPEPILFVGPDSYFATLLHELGHWSGHEKRLKRDLSNRFGSKAYAAEELVAELTAAFLCAHLEVRGELRHAGYVETWISLLKEDSRAIFTAASKASQAADYLRSFSKKEDNDEPEL